MFLIYIIGCFTLLGFYEYNREKDESKEMTLKTLLLGVMFWPILIMMLVIVAIVERRKE
jgi:RsiW-degrading membrane proteinase PrsW (M82 family)